MTEYIEREKVKEVIKDYGKGAIEDGQQTLDPVDDILLLHGAIDMIPTADVVEVVRCKDCKYSRPRNKSEKNIYFEDVLICESCEMADEPCAVCETDFCSYGERKGKE